MEFRDRNVVVTGGTGALGVAVVGALLESGALCHVPCTSDAKGREYPHRSHARLRLVTTGSLTDETAVQRLFDGAPGLWASIHLVGGFAAAPIGATDKAALMRQIDGNFVTCFLCSRAAVQSMSRGKTGGRIVNVAARPGVEWRTGAGMTAYAASKAALAAFTVALAEEVAKEGILVNSVVPSIMDTPANREAMPRADHAAWPKVEEVAQTILFLASPENKVTRGALAPVYGRT
jgi:NAD(P)-dependent dehydrogenase (short-subunit alcohol dehydrogenase family)